MRRATAGIAGMIIDKARHGKLKLAGPLRPLLAAVTAEVCAQQLYCRAIRCALPTLLNALFSLPFVR